MAFLTVTPDQLLELAGVCERQAAAVGDIGTAVHTKVTSVEWNSPAATQFRIEWESTHFRNLQNLMKALQDLGRESGKMAQRYQAADDSYRGAS